MAADEPTLWTHLYSRLRGEVPWGALEAYRRAGASVFELMEHAEHRRLQCRIEGLDPWTMPASMRGELLCVWNAFVSHVLGAALLDADEQHHPRSRGYLPPAVAAEAMSCFQAAERWVSLARQARGSDSFRVEAPLPAEIPRARVVPGTSVAHFQGLLRALHLVHGHAAAALGSIPERPAGARAQAEAERIRRKYAAAEAQAHFAETLWSARAPVEIRARAEVQVRWALGEFHQVGQWIAEPALCREGEAQAEERRPTPVAPHALFLVIDNPRLPVKQRARALDRALRGPVSVDALAELYERVDLRKLRVRILAALEERPEKAAVEMLARVARGGDPALRDVARQFLGRMDHPHAVAYREQLRRDAREAEWKDAFARVVEEDQDVEERKLILASAFHLNPPVAELNRLFQSVRELPLRGMVLRALQRHTDPEGREVLGYIGLYGSDRPIRELALELYWSWRPPSD